jgi:hypothetical protein
MKDEAPERLYYNHEYGLQHAGKIEHQPFALSMPCTEYRRADAPPTLAEAMRCGDVRELVGHATAAAFTLRLLSKMDGDKCDQLQKGLLGIIARLKGETP